MILALRLTLLVKFWTALENIYLNIYICISQGREKNLKNRINITVKTRAKVSRLERFAFPDFLKQENVKEKLLNIIIILLNPEIYFAILKQWLRIKQSLQLHLFKVYLLRMSRVSRPRAKNKATATTTSI